MGGAVAEPGGGGTVFSDAGADIELGAERRMIFSPPVIIWAKRWCWRGNTRRWSAICAGCWWCTLKMFAARLVVGQALVELGRLDEALVQLERVVALRPDDIRGHFSLGRVLELMGQKRAAERHSWAGARTRARQPSGAQAGVGGVE